MKTVTVVGYAMIIAGASLILLSGCATGPRNPSGRYPFNVMLDPVTEEVPDVQR